MRHTFYFNVKALDNKGKVNFKIYDVINGEGNNYNTHTVQYRRIQRKWKIEIWSVDWIQQEKYFPSNIMQKMRQRSVPDLFLEKKEALHELEASDNSLW